MTAQIMERPASVEAAVFNWITENATNNSFAASLLSFMRKRGELTDGQAAAVRRNLAPKINLDMSAVADKLQNAVNAGLKNPKLRLDGLCFSMAKPTSANPNHIYVTENATYGSTYFGKIDPSGRFSDSRDCSSGVKDRLTEISKDVLKAATDYGKMSGSCSACSRQLTEKKSIEMGIGPICRKKWGL